MIVVRVKRKREDPVPPSTLLLLVDQPSGPLHGEELVDSASSSAYGDAETRPLKRRPDEVPSYVALQRVTTAPSIASSSVAVLDKFTLDAVRKQRNHPSALHPHDEEIERPLNEEGEVAHPMYNPNNSSYMPSSNNSAKWTTHGKRKIAFLDEEDEFRRSDSRANSADVAPTGISTSAMANRGVVVLDIHRVGEHRPTLRTSSIVDANLPVGKTSASYNPTSSDSSVRNSTPALSASAPIPSHSISTGPSLNAQKSSPGKRILDPASRAMNAAIESAFQTGDFAPVFRALEIGSSVNFQTQQHGITALMAAAFHGDVKTVSLLLNKGADPSISTPLPSAMDGFVEDRCAMDFASDPDFFGNHSKAVPSALQNVMFLLRQSPSMYQGAALRSRGRIKDTVSEPVHKHTTVDGDMGGENDKDYVVDIYCLPNKPNGDAESDILAQAELSRVHDPEVFNQLAASAAMVSVTGLRLTRDALTGDLLDVDITDEQFHYDSDWSDLGDDEDPDSNDERYFGNDYPDEEQGDESRSSVDNDEEYEGECGMYHDYGSAEEDVECEPPTLHSKTKYGRSNAAPRKYVPKFLAGNRNKAQQNRGPQISLKTGVRFSEEPLGRADESDDGSGSGRDSDDSNDQSDSDFVDADDATMECDADDDDSPTHLTGAGRAGRIGQVMHSFTRDDAMAPVNRTHGALGRLWSGADSAANENLSQEPEFRAQSTSNRIHEMDERLGLVPFESNANEFDERGIPKYGFDLSDDGADELIVQQSYGSEVPFQKQNNSTVTSNRTYDMSEYSKFAYDPELDESD